MAYPGAPWGLLQGLDEQGMGPLWAHPGAVSMVSLQPQERGPCKKPLVVTSNTQASDTSIGLRDLSQCIQNTTRETVSTIIHPNINASNTLWGF